MSRAEPETSRTTGGIICASATELPRTSSARLAADRHIFERLEMRHYDADLLHAVGWRLEFRPVVGARLRRNVLHLAAAHALLLGVIHHQVFLLVDGVDQINTGD